MAYQGLYASLRQLLEVGYFHADPHPGNLVAIKDGSIAYFDFGMMGDIPRHYRVGLIQVVSNVQKLFFEGLHLEMWFRVVNILGAKAFESPEFSLNSLNLLESFCRTIFILYIFLQF